MRRRDDDARPEPTRPRTVTMNKTKSNLNAALTGAANGYYIAPINRAGETLAGPASKDAAQIWEWWERWPTAAVGLDLGRSQMVVVEIRAELAERLAGVLPPTPLIARWKNKRRYFYRRSGFWPPPVSRTGGVKVYVDGIMVVPS